MSFLPVLKSFATGGLLITLFLWKSSFLPLIIALFLVSLVFFWFDLINSDFHYESAFWLFIVSEVMAFGSLLVCCFWFDSGSFVKLSRPIEIPFLGCFLLLGSRITVTAFHHILNYKLAWVLLLLTAVLGVCFVALQMVELNEVLISITDRRFHASRFCTIGLHFRHVLLGVVGLVTVLVIGHLQVGFYRCSVVTWYWHFVDYVWLFVYTFVYVC